jgi:hypothetical protein
LRFLRLAGAAIDQGGGGGYVVTGLPADPSCAAKVDTAEERAQVYAGGMPPSGPPSAAGSAVAPAGAVSKHKKKCKRQRKNRCRKHRR